MVETGAVGYMGVPLGLAGPFLIDGTEVMIPMATEEPSVIAAASFAGSLLARHGGITTRAAEPVMTAQLFVEGLANGDEASDRVHSAETEIRTRLADTLQTMENRGGGWRGLDTRWIAPSRTLVVNLKIDVRDAMGANLLNTAAEEVRPMVEKNHRRPGSDGNSVQPFTGQDRHRRIPASRLPSWDAKGFIGSDTAERIIRAAEIARQDPDRAVTHNKGIMNGISALALATGNDTRAIEAAAHSYAGRFGPYHGLSEYRRDGEDLHGLLEMPLPFAVTGGAVGFHPVSRWALELMGKPDATQLSRYAAALGLAQNLSAPPLPPPPPPAAPCQ